MTWVRIDDHLHAHPKFRAAWDAEPSSIGLELFALSQSAAYLTDGQVDELFVRSWFQNARRRQRAVDALLHTGLWVPNGAGWRIHDYLDYNESRAQVEQRRTVDATRKRTARRVSS
jgi:hypothetical protein